MAGERRPLRVINPAGEARPLKRFCGHCGAAPGDGRAAMPGSRVCASCGLGLLLEATRDTTPTSADSFLVVDSRMAVSALSRRAERLLGVSEPEAVNRHLREFLIAADADPGAAERLFACVLAAASGWAEAETIAVRPAGEFGVRYWARISSCGPSTAALLLVFNMD